MLKAIHTGMPEVNYRWVPGTLASHTDIEGLMERSTLTFSSLRQRFRNRTNHAAEMQGVSNTIQTLCTEIYWKHQSHFVL